jgi:hypothetical protein
MSFAWVDHYDLTDEEYRQMTTERAGNLRTFILDAISLCFA